MKKTIILIAAMLIAYSGFSQSCNGKHEEDLAGLNTESKCSISNESKDDEDVLKVNVSVSKARFMKSKDKVSMNRRKKLIARSIAKLRNSLSKKKLNSASKFSELDVLPAFDACARSLNKVEQNSCFNKAMSTYINKYFFYPQEAVQNNIQGTIWVRFIVDESGDINNVKTIGKSNAGSLKEVAYFIISKLPKLKPAVKGGVNVPCKYSFPIVFDLQEN